MQVVGDLAKIHYVELGARMGISRCGRYPPEDQADPWLGRVTCLRCLVLELRSAEYRVRFYRDRMAVVKGGGG